MGGILSAAALGGGLSASVSPPSASGGGQSGGFVPAVTAFVAGGSGPITYSWNVIQPDPVYPLFINTPASQSTSFDFGEVAPRATARAVVRMSATRNGNTVFVDVPVTFTDNTPISGGGPGSSGGELPGSGRFPTQ